MMSVPSPRPAPDPAAPVHGPGAPALALVGRLDVHAAADIRNALADAVDAGTGELVVDLAALEGVDATGLGVLVGAHRRAQRAGRSLVLSDVPDPVGRLLFVTRLDRVLLTRRSAGRSTGTSSGTGAGSSSGSRETA